MFFTSITKSFLSLLLVEQPTKARYGLGEATVVLAIEPKSVGRVVLHDVYWKAKLTEGSVQNVLAVGRTVAIDYRKGLTLYVHPID